MIRNAFLGLALCLPGGFLRAQSVEVAAIGGLGVAGGEEQARRFAAGGGVSAGFSEGRHGVRLDYFFGNKRGDEFQRHFVTGSYVVQQRSGTSRPFFQIGAGLVRVNRKDGLNALSSGENDFAVILGGGVTLDIGRALFIRPELRSYWYVGPTIAVLPSVSVGWRF